MLYNENYLQRSSTMTEDEWKENRETVLSFFQIKDGLIIHKRIDKELLDAINNRAKLSERGKKAALARHSSNAQAMHKQCTSKPKAKLGHNNSNAQAMLKRCPLPPPLPSSIEEGGQAPKIPEKEKSERKKFLDDLFNAVAKICRLDPKSKINGGLIGKVRTYLADSEPPYSPEDVFEFARRFPELCHHARGENRGPTANEIEKYISRIRDDSTQKFDDEPELPFIDAAFLERQRNYRAEPMWKLKEREEEVRRKASEKSS